MRGDEHPSYDGAARAAPAPATRRETAPTSAAGAGTSAEPDVHAVLRSRGYVLLLVAAAVLALPLSAIAFGFLAAVGWLQQLVWQGLPHQLGWATPPAWLPLPVLALAGLAVGAAIRYLPGHGGHVPADGLAGGLTEPRSLPGVTLAALAGLSLGAVIGPEAPLIALGGGLALFAADRTKLGSDPQGRMLIALAGSAAAIATIFGNPLVAVILLMEVVAIANKAVMVAIVPCFVSGGSRCGAVHRARELDRAPDWDPGSARRRRHHAGLGRPRVRRPVGCRCRAARARGGAPREAHRRTRADPSSPGACRGRAGDRGPRWHLRPDHRPVAG